ncbi:MAG TPA: hypothetical protein VF375_05600 [Candidatus Limnocylindrales bacterium]
MFWLLVPLWFCAVVIVASGLTWTGFEWRRCPVAARRMAPVVLFIWFAYWGWSSIAGAFTDWPAHLDTVGIDGRLYYRAAAMFMHGGDPWTAYTSTNTWPPGSTQVHFFFTGPPPTVLAFVPFVWIPEPIFVAGWMALTIAAAFYTLRRLHLPFWWVLFPPMMQGILVANPQVVCLALMLAGSSWLRALAAPMKAYALIPMVALRQWRALVILALAGLASIVLFWPLWSMYRADFAATDKWLVETTGGGWSAARDPGLWAVAAVLVVLLALMNRRDAGWLAVPSLWPASQFFYATFVLPLRSPWLAAVLAVSHRVEYPRMSEILVVYLAFRVVHGVLGRIGVGALVWRMNPRWAARLRTSATDMAGPSERETISLD